MVSQSSGSGIKTFLVLAVFAIMLVWLLLAVLPQDLPSLGDVQPGAHAVERHGQDAVDARNALLGCKSLQSKLCPGKEGSHGLSVVFWCETDGPLCPGMYTTIGGSEKTTFIRPCSQWRQCR